MDNKDLLEEIKATVDLLLKEEDKATQLKLAVLSFAELLPKECGKEVISQELFTMLFALIKGSSNNETDLEVLNKLKSIFQVLAYFATEKIKTLELCSDMK